MARVYNTVEGVKGGLVKHQVPDGRGGSVTKFSVANSVERVVAMHEDVQRRLRVEGLQVAQRASFRLDAAQARKIMLLKEDLQVAIKAGDPAEIKAAQARLSFYLATRTQVTHGPADIDYHIGMYRPVGNAFNAAENQADEELRRDILKRSLTM